MSARHYLSYTYFLKWTILNKKYYGSRIANEVEPRKDLLIKYDTSSDPVKRLLRLFGKPDVIRVDKTFTSEQEARDYEYNFLQENNCRPDLTWLNRHDNPAPPSRKGKKNSKEHKEKIRNSIKGFNHPNYGGKYETLETKKKKSISQKGKNKTNKHKENISNSTKGKNNHFYGKTHTKEQKIKWSKERKGIISPNRQKVKIKEIIYESQYEAAIKMNVSPSTICKWTKNGKAEKV